MYASSSFVVHHLMIESSQLQSQLPALFKKGNIEQRLSFATRVILVNHGRHRKQHTSRIVKNKPNVRPSLAERMAANLASITNGTRAPRIFASPAPALRKVPPSSSSSVKIESPLPEIPASASRSPRARREHSSALPAQTSNPNVNVRTPSSSISGPGSSNAQFSLPFLARHDSSHIAESEAIKVETPSSRTPSISSRNMLAGSSTFTSCRDEQARGCQICRVHKFLDAAIPSMTHLLHQFIEFGCLGEDFLFAVSTWSPEVIRIFLRSLPPGPGGHALTKMEVEILTYHFESYFLVSNSKA